IEEPNCVEVEAQKGLVSGPVLGPVLASKPGSWKRLVVPQLGVGDGEGVGVGVAVGVGVGVGVGVAAPHCEPVVSVMVSILTPGTPGATVFESATTRKRSLMLCPLAVAGRLTTVLM